MKIFIMIIMIIMGLSFLYGLLKIVDAFVFPIKYCLNGDRDINSVSFVSHIPFQKGKV